MQVSLEGSLALFMLQQDFQHILFCFLFLIEWNKNFSTVAAHEMHMNTRKHFSGNQSLRKVTRIRNHNVYNQTRVSK